MKKALCALALITCCMRANDFEQMFRYNPTALLYVVMLAEMAENEQRLAAAQTTDKKKHYTPTHLYQNRKQSSKEHHGKKRNCKQHQPRKRNH